MRSVIISIVTVLLCVVGGVFMGYGFADCTTKPVRHENLACVVAHRLNLPNAVYDELVSGWGFTPDTCLAQAAEMQGSVRIPTQVVWCGVGVGEPICKTVYDLRVKK